MLPLDFVSQKVFTKSFSNSQFPHKSVNLFFILVTIKDKSTDLGGDWLLRNNFTNTFCERRSEGDAMARLWPGLSCMCHIHSTAVVHTPPS